GAFGNDAVLIEKLIDKPRHIEVQIFGDGTRALHLFERDCSLQRRHQKVIEEAPAPGMTPQMRAAMGQAAVRAAEAIGYAGAGTVEFIVDASRGLHPDGFWFMEMNTRLQVEHPVTEAITGVDLVEWQLRIAAGEALPCAQEDLAIDGHAFEARLYAEDVAAGFLPATGRLTHLQFPEGARADTGVRAGDEISPWYDPMIAKITVHGPTRAVALRKLEGALAATQVAGSVTNLSFLRRLAGHAGFAAGDVDTGLIARDQADLAATPVPSTQMWSLAALGALGLDAPAGPVTGFTLWEPLKRHVVLRHAGDTALAVVATRLGGMAHVAVAGAVHEVARIPTGWQIDGVQIKADIVVNDALVSVFWHDGYSFDIIDPLAVAATAGAGSGQISAPMPGLVKAVFVAPGDAVATGDRLAVLEAMKMEHALVAGRDGIVAEVLVNTGAQVEAGAALIILAEEDI
ncbi:MAG: biotin/lipoyl-containing protein, partial [Roseicyclus sp.]|uniref:ATP-binding protein n=1 Tax=Roseicyclus sp. TaxID=1914329 RepID=UPI003BB16375